MSDERIVMDERAIDRALSRVAHEILERHKGTENLVLIGVRSRGIYIADRLREKIKAIENVELPKGVIDITLYRDDLSRAQQRPQVRGTNIPFPIDDKTVLLVDDVLFTGRTVRAALDALMDFGRPRCVQFVVLVDRGHRELPVKADYVGKNIPTSPEEDVRVHLRGCDDRDEVTVRGGGVE